MGRGDAMTPPAPSGVVTFLFTDVEGSTRRWETDADGMRIALAAHDEVLRATLETHGGFMFKHTGDGVCAAFSSPKSAVDTAVAAQRALELPVRMGMATGEAELREGDYFGTVLNRFVCQGALGSPLSVYGSGGQRRGFIHIEDSIRCMTTALENPAAEGEFRVANQLTEIKSVKDLASTVSNITGAELKYVHNPRVEAAVHPYRVTHEVLPALGFKASQLLTDDAIEDMLNRVSVRAELAGRREELEADPKVFWRQK